MGTQIKRSNFSSSWLGTYSDSTGSVSNNSEFYFICAPSFVFYVKANKRTGQLFPTHPHIIVRVRYWNGSSWVQVYEENYLNGEYNETFKLYHNRSTETVDSNYYYKDTEHGTNHYHLWVVATEYNRGPDSFTGQNVSAWYGGAGLMTDAEYNFVLQGKKIRGNGTISNGSDGFILYKGKMHYSSDWQSSYGAEALNKFNPDLNSGSKITSELQHHLIQGLT